MAEDLSIDSALGTTLKGYSTKVNEDADPNDQGYLDFDGYLKLMVAQMSNQDFNDPMSDSEFLQQMATYSMMDTISKMNEQSQISYAASLVGKAVTVGDGTNVDTGLVESVIISDGKYQLLVSGSKYDSDKVTDIVDPSTYTTLSKLVGIEATGKRENGETVTGKISNILVRDGLGYVIIENEMFPFDSVSFDKKDADTGDKNEGADKTEGTQGDKTESTEGDKTEGTGTENTENPGNTDQPSAGDQTDAAANSGAGDNGTSTASVKASGASMWLADDGIEVNSRAVDGYAEQKLNEYYSSLLGTGEDEEVFDEVYTDEYSTVLNAVKNSMEGVSAASAARQSAVMGDNGFYTTKVENVASKFSAKNDPGEEEGTVVRGSTAMADNSDDEDYDYLTDIDVKGDEIVYDEEEDIEEYLDYEDVPVEAGLGEAAAVAGSNSMNSVNNTAASGRVTSAMTSSYAVRRNGDYAEDPGIDIGDGLTDGRNKNYSEWPLSNRAFQYLYPNEAALANEYGTKMFDIRFIHNTDINSVINTDLILGSTVSGKYFTDIGYSGKGNLGEVVTWSDGTQRVEVIGKNGSTWFTTSGNYTLDEICNFSDSFSLANRLTPFEKVIRAAAKEYTPAQQAAMERDRQFYARHAYYNSSTLLGN